MAKVCVCVWRTCQSCSLFMIIITNERLDLSLHRLLKWVVIVCKPRCTIYAVPKYPSGMLMFYNHLDTDTHALGSRSVLSLSLSHSHFISLVLCIRLLSWFFILSFVSFHSFLSVGRVFPGSCCCLCLKGNVFLWVSGGGSTAERERKWVC